jgi:5'(3')-deoxyribonucleotidase
MRANELIRATERTKIYLDMDGVLADFFAEYAKLAGVTSGSYRDIPPAKADPTLDKMIGTDFFHRLPKFSTADSLVKLVLQYVPTYAICSSPLRGDHANSELHKRAWIKDHLNPQPAEIIITGMKERHAVNADGSPNILIDDRGTNIVAWRARGGIGIKYQADEDSLDVIAKGLAHAYGH